MNNQPKRTVAYSMFLSGLAVLSSASLIPNPEPYALETNDVEHLAFFSNIVKSVVVARDRDLLYTTLRDAIKSDESGGPFYGGMSSMPMWQLLWTGEETNLVQALYDPLVSTRFRRHALSQLKMRFGWPATNTVPEL